MKKYILNRRDNDGDVVVESADNTGSLYVTLMDDLIKRATSNHSITIKHEPDTGIDLAVTLTNHNNGFEIIKWVVFEG